MKKSISMDHEVIENMIVATSDLSSALWEVAYSGTSKFILGDDPAQEGSRAIEFVRNYADLTGAVLRTISCMSEVITTGIVNDEIEVTLKQNSPD